MKRPETIEKKHEEIISTLNGFFEEQGFKDSEGNLVHIDSKEVHWPTSEEEIAYKNIRALIESDAIRPYLEKNVPLSYDEKLKPMLLAAADFLSQPATFDSIKKKSDHRAVRMPAEIALGAAAEKDSQKYSEAYKTYYNNRLSVGKIRNIVGLYGMFDEDDFGYVTNESYGKLSQWMQDVEDEDGNYCKKYEVVDDSEKFQATEAASEFVRSFFSDLEKMSKGEPVEKDEAMAA